MGGFDVLVDEAALVGLAQGSGDADREAQEAADLHGRAEQPTERFSAAVLEQQHGPTAFADEFRRPRRPCAVQVVFQFIFMCEAVEAGGRRAFPGRRHNQYGALFAVGARRAPTSAEDALAVLPRDPETAIPIGREQRALHCCTPPQADGRQLAQKRPTSALASLRRARSIASPYTLSPRLTGQIYPNRAHHCNGCGDNRYGAEVTDYGHSGTENFALIHAHGPQRPGLAENFLPREDGPGDEQRSARRAAGVARRPVQQIGVEQKYVAGSRPAGRDWVHPATRLARAKRSSPAAAPGPLRGDRRAGENCSDRGRRPHGPRARSRILQAGAVP